MSTKPQPEQLCTAAEYRWARRHWIRKHGGSLPGTLALAIGFGRARGSAFVLGVCVAGALLGTAYIRAKP